VTNVRGTWRDGRETIKHFREFLNSCVQEVGGALGATAGSRSTEHPDFIWQDFWRGENWRIGVVFHHTDAGPRLKRRPPAHSPILRLGVRTRSWPDAALRGRLESDPPPRWEIDPDRWYSRATIWRHLSDVIGDGDFEQRARLAAACADAGVWIDRVIASG